VTRIGGGWRLPDPSNEWLRRGVTFRFEPVGCGVRITFPARRGDKLEYSAFMRGRKRDVQVARGVVTDATQAVTFDHPGKVKLETGYASAADPRLVRARIRFEPAAADTIGITVCAR
jgi:hypothetical protein